MKTLFILSTVAIVSLWAGSIQSDEQFKQAVEGMGAEDKLVLMIYTAPDCPECAYMKQKVFHDRLTERYLEQNFVVIEKNVHQGELPDGFDYFGIPTMFFIDKSGVKKETVVGSKRPKAFSEILHLVRGDK